MNQTEVGLYEIQGMHLSGVRIGKLSSIVMREPIECFAIPCRQLYGISYLVSQTHSFEKVDTRRNGPASVKKVTSIVKHSFDAVTRRSPRRGRGQLPCRNRHEGDCQAVARRAGCHDTALPGDPRCHPLLLLWCRRFHAANCQRDRGTDVGPHSQCGEKSPCGPWESR